MVKRVFRRIVSVLLAIAFLGGGIPSMAAAAVVAAKMSSTIAPAHYAHEHHAAGGEHSQPAVPDNSVPTCRHGSDCLICGAVDLPGSTQSIRTHDGVRVVFGFAHIALRGLTPQPELFPPIVQS